MTTALFGYVAILLAESDVFERPSRSGWDGMRCCVLIITMSKTIGHVGIGLNGLTIRLIVDE
jgi:hypothetical protein